MTRPVSTGRSGRTRDRAGRPVQFSTSERNDGRMYPAPDDRAPGPGTSEHALARELGLVHAQARAARHLLGVDPEAAARALRDITEHTGAAVEAMAAVRLPRPVHLSTGEGRLGALLTGFRAGGGALRLAVIGPAEELSPTWREAVRQLAHDALEAATACLAGWDLSFSLTRSPDRLDVLAVCGPAAGQEHRHSTGVPQECFDRTSARVTAAGGTLRVTAPAAGGFVAAASLTDAPAGARIDP